MNAHTVVPDLISEALSPERVPHALNNQFSSLRDKLLKSLWSQQCSIRYQEILAQSFVRLILEVVRRHIVALSYVPKFPEEREIPDVINEQWKLRPVDRLG